MIARSRWVKYLEVRMTISLYDVGLKTYLQVLPAVSNFLEKGRVFFEEKGTDLNEVVKISLYEDMAPLAFQIFSVSHHSLGAINGLESGQFGPPRMPPELDYQALQGLVREAEEKIKGMDEATINGYEGGDVVFKMGSNSLPFVAEDFIMTFSLPNFYFHATTAYDILRKEGVPVGKMDFLGSMRMKG